MWLYIPYRLESNKVPVEWKLTPSETNWACYDLLPHWLAMHSQLILMFCASQIKRVRQVKCVIQSGGPVHGNAAVSVINYFTPTVSDVLSLHFLSISFSALSLLYFISPYYEESVKSLAMKWAIHAWLQGIKKAPCRPRSPLFKLRLTSHIKMLLIFMLPCDAGLNLLWLPSYRQTDGDRENHACILPCKDPCTASSGT